MSRPSVSAVVGDGYSPTAPSEKFWAAGTIEGWKGKRKLLLYIHGSGNDAWTPLYSVSQRDYLHKLAQRYNVFAADFGLQVWGNDTHRLRIAEGIAYARTIFNMPPAEPVILNPGSMGTLGGLGYLKDNPTQVSAVAAMIPALDLLDLMGRGLTPDINAAYGGAYNDVTMGPTYSPVKYAAALAPAVPIHLYTSSNDTITVPATATAFVNARPQTLRTDIGTNGHSDASLAIAAPLIIDWLNSVVGV